jgi:hypothetical protein
LRADGSASGLAKTPATEHIGDLETFGVLELVLSSDASLASEYPVAERIVRGCLLWRVAGQAQANQGK